jgi:hypothetical protein
MSADIPQPVRLMTVCLLLLGAADERQGDRKQGLRQESGSVCLDGEEQVKFVPADGPQRGRRQ